MCINKQDLMLTIYEIVRCKFRLTSLLTTVCDGRTGTSHYMKIQQTIPCHAQSQGSTPHPSFAIILFPTRQVKPTA